MLLASVSSSWAGAVLQSGVSVQALQGTTWSVVAAGYELTPGTRLINRDVKGEATLAFDDGCSISLLPGQVFTVGQASPCSFKADVTEGAGLSAPLLIGGVLVTGAIVGGIIAATSNNGGQSPIPLLPLSR